MAMLEVHGLTVHYSKLEVVKHVSLEIEEGSIVTLLGANGSGKSTIFRAISGLKTPTAGDIWFQGKRITGMPAYKITRMGLCHVPEGRGLFPYLTVLENLQLGAYVRSNKRKEGLKEDIKDIFKRFPVLEEKKNTHARTLSGGQQAMLAIGRSLLAKPKLLMLDEPAQGLAPLVIGELCNIINQINESGITIMLIEHNVRMALGIAHKVYILQNGELIFEGDPKASTETEYVKKVYLAD